MKKTLLLISVFGWLAGCSQTSKTVVKTHAFFMVPVPGTIPVDEQGKPTMLKRDTLYTVVMEVHGKAPLWTAAWVGARSFTVLATPAQERQVVAGKRFSDEKPIVIKSANKNSLWEICLMPAATVTKPALNIKQGELLLEGRLSGKRVYCKISILTELASPAYQ